MRKIAISLLIGAWCLCTTATATTVAADTTGCDAWGRSPTAPHPAVVRVVVCGTAACRSLGSGTLVYQDQRQAIVLTCAHLFRDGQGTTTVQFPTGQCLPATVLEVDPAWDLAVLATGPAGAEAVTIADEYPRPGETLESCGYGPDGRYWCNRGRALGYARTDATNTYETLQLTGSARDGDSGGPVFNGRGELVAVIWGTDGRTVAGTYCGRVRKFLSRILPFRRPPPQQPIAVPVSPDDPGQTPLDGSGRDDVRRRLDALAAGLLDADRRWQEERQAMLARLDGIESGVGRQAEEGGRVAEGAHEVLPSGGKKQGGGWGNAVLAVLPGLLAALGWTGPPSVAAVLAARLAVAVIRKRRQKSAAGRRPRLSSLRSGAALNDEYARQLADVFALSGRSPLADATLGREYDEELRRAEESSDGALAAWAKKLRSRVARRFYRIHAQQPSPAEPAEQ